MSAPRLRMFRILWCAALAASCSSPARTPVGPNEPAAPAPAPTAEAPATPATAPADAPDRGFEALVARFLDENFRYSPDFATQIGEHRYDATWPDVSVAGRDRYHKFLDDMRAELGKFPRDRLSPQNQVDAATLDDVQRYGLFTLDELKLRDTDPLSYVGMIGDGLDPLV